jgi:hypothetical protein
VELPDRPGYADNVIHFVYGSLQGPLSATTAAANLCNSYTDEASFFLERSVITDLVVRAGFVWRKDTTAGSRQPEREHVQRASTFAPFALRRTSRASLGSLTLVGLPMDRPSGAVAAFERSF